MQKCIVIMITSINNKSISDLILLSEIDAAKLHIYKLNEELTQYKYDSPYFIEHKGEHYSITEDTFDKIMSFREIAIKRGTDKLDKSYIPYI